MDKERVCQLMHMESLHGYLAALVCSGCSNKTKSLASLSNRNLFPTVLGDERSKIEVPEYSVPGKGPRPGLQTAALTLGAPMAVP